MKYASFAGTLTPWNPPFAAILLLLLLRVSLVAQSIVTGGISGTVADPTGALVGGATVALTAPLTGASLATVTNSAGLYSFPLLKPGSYTVSVTEPGFSSARQKVEVLLGRTTSANIKLTLGNVSATVEVSAESELTQKEDANLTTSVPQRQIENLPSPGGDLTNFAQTTPGILMNTSSGGGYGNFSAFGLPATSNLFSINGADYNISGASNLLLGSNEIQEIAVVTNGYTGQYGRHAGAQVSYSTKSGTNLLHGNASYFWTGRAMDANDWFNNFNRTPRPFQNNNQWTVSLGGPIKKNKIFFFVNTEGLRYVFGTSQQIFLPAALFQSEVLSNLPAAAVPFYKNMFDLYNVAPGAQRAVLSPNSCGSYAPVDPAIGTSCLTTYRDASTNGNREWLLSARVDVDLRQNDAFFLRWKMDRGYQPTYTDPINPIFNIGSNQPITEGQVNYTHTFSPTLVNNVLFSIVHTSFVFASPNLTKALNLFPYILRSTDSSLTPLGPGSGSNANFPQGGEGPGFQLIDDASWAIGHHSLRSGLNLTWGTSKDYNPGTQPFPAVSTSLASLAEGLADLVNQNFTVTPIQHGSGYAIGVYAQDQWAVNPKLKLTLTLRGDYNPVGICKERCASFTSQPFNSPTFSHSAEVPYNQMMVSSKHILRSSELIVLQPRIGFAFSPLNGSTVIRGGGGLFMDTQGLGDYFSTNFPSVNRFYVPGPFALAPEMAGSAESSVAACNTAFTSNFYSGGTVNSYLNAQPTCGLPSLFDVTQEFKSPKYLEWNLEVQHSISNSTALSLNYVGNYGFDEVSFLSAPNGFGFAHLPTSPPDTRVAFVGQFTNGAHSNYNGLTASLNQHMWKGFTGRLNWTWSHSIDDVSNGVAQYSLNNSVLVPFDPECLRCLNHASSDYDVRTNLTASYVWNLPFHTANHLGNGVLGGWTVSQTFYYRSGYPFTIEDGVLASSLAANNIFTVGMAYPSGVGVLPQNCGGPKVTDGVIAPCFTSDMFLPAGTEQGFGGFSRNSFRGPGYFNTDLTVRKNFKFTERLAFSVAVIFYNVLNHPNFANPVGNLANSSQFGVINQTVSPPTTPYGAFAAAAEDARIVQINGRVTF